MLPKLYPWEPFNFEPQKKICINLCETGASPLQVSRFLVIKTNIKAVVSYGGSQSSAYRKAYDASKMAAKTVWEEPSRLRKHPKVAARIMELEAEKEARRRMQALS